MKILFRNLLFCFNKLRKLLELCFLFLFVLASQFYSLESKAQNNAIPIWRGFIHQTKYGQPATRIGDYIFKDAQNSENGLLRLAHSGGSAPYEDEFYFESHYTLVQSNLIESYQDSVEFIFEAEKSQKIRLEKEVNLSPSLFNKLYENYVGILNGYELIALTKAQKIQQFEIMVSDGSHDPQKDSITFECAAILQTSCKGKGCKKSLKKSKYRLVLHYLILAGAPQDFTNHSVSLKKRYYWDTKVELEPPKNRVELKCDSSGIFSNVVPAFKRISFNFDKSYTFTEWNMAIDSPVYNKNIKVISLTPNLYFKQWNNYKKFSIENYNKKSAKYYPRKSGLVEFSFEIGFLHFNKACVSDHIIKGSQKLSGTLSDFSSDENRYRSAISYHYNCK